MATLKSLAWKGLYLNLALNLFGLLAIVVCNVGHVYCFALVYYLSGALFLGPPLLLLTIEGAPAGTFRRPRLPQAHRYRTLFWLNQGIVALIFLPTFLLA
ncbi:hypothetical protein [Hymenobacter defluvii]|uniref:Uncharacterized protein n=1 Tax=Hymenobacter defluvii TaxID=2054411 RepID=A0ABS3TIC7_9BACT|nr:hypothetical protein [Hymenobacter defluvii]MBO3272339.1 hypothetical protein [Hymenobacter defluvii]